ncbi:MAG: hypothetical protein WA130_06535 [Candidatus Methanoperedens sp.]
MPYFKHPVLIIYPNLLILYYPSTGAFYSIYSSVFGKRLSATIVVLYMISAVFGIATIAAGIGQYVSYLGYSDILRVEIGVIIFFATVNIIGARPSSNIEMILTLLKWRLSV